MALRLTQAYPRKQMHSRWILCLFVGSLALVAHCKDTNAIDDEAPMTEEEAKKRYGNRMTINLDDDDETTKTTTPPPEEEPVDESGILPDEEPEEERIEKSLNPDHMKVLHGKIDTNGDGKMNLDEIMAFWKLMRKDMIDKTLDVQIEMMDNDGDKKISMEELVGQYADRFSDDADEEEKLREKQVHDLEIAKFSAADKNGDGFLDREELPAAIYPEAHPEILRLMGTHALETKDKNKDGKLDANEFWETPPEEEHTEELLADFRKLDKDASGFLDLQEIIEWETGTFHTTNAMSELFELTGRDQDTGITIEEFHEHLPNLKSTEAATHFADWAEHHEL